MQGSHKKSFTPRARYLTEQLTIEQQQPLSLDVTGDVLPAEFARLTGAVRSIRPMTQYGHCLIFFIEADRGEFVMKVARGGYRSQELQAEHAAMELLAGGSVPVPRTLTYAQFGDLSCHLRAYAHGQLLSDVLDSPGCVRSDAIRRMGSLLASIHATELADTCTWEEWVSASLEQAARNVAAGVCDPEEFTNEPPGVLLDRLLSNQPIGPGSVCLLHGDFRPKNLLWESGRIASVIDWQFVDVGDPYYDLGIIHWYMRDEAEWRLFLDAYGVQELDRERFEFCWALQKFLNV